MTWVSIALLGLALSFSLVSAALLVIVAIEPTPNYVLQPYALMRFKCTRVMPGPPHLHETLWRLASPKDQLHADAPPFFIVHGTHNSLTSVPKARAFAKSMRKVSGRSLSAERVAVQHAVDILTTSLTRYLSEAARYYLDYQYSHQPAGSDPMNRPWQIEWHFIEHKISNWRNRHAD